MNLSELHQIHRRHLLSLRRSEGTVEYYSQTITSLERYMASEGLTPDLTAVDKPLLQGFVLHLRQRGLAPGGEHATMRGIRATLRWAFEEELIPNNPMARFKLAPVPQVMPPAVSGMEAKAALKAAKETSHPLRDQAILLTLLDTGVRLSELLQLQTADIDLARGMVRVREETSKRKKERRVPIGIKAGKAITIYERRERKPARPHIQEMFLNRSGLPMSKSGLHNLMLRLAQSADIPPAHLSPHACRRAFATMALTNGVDVFTLREMMGHASLEQTRVYLRLSEEDLQRAHLRASPADRL
ncbi:tyrosine-type recombinase/integrase [Deinococcus sp. RM]|uniref:tyrosine-type recombinase/integrase n=1 Tax=Deinococcus sp. RM TaxID=2316359 RepID=UPI0013146CA7|nr:tyrosine-type recombinase/integrase [Deinococcus sp. RM]